MSQRESPPDPWVRVIRIKDGDSLIVQSLAYPEARPFEIRLYGIDAPEFDQPFGRHASTFLDKIAVGKTFRLHHRELDRYGRVVGILYLSQHKSLNLDMVVAGWAYAYITYGILPGVREAEAGARMHRRGVWAMPGGGVRPWTWRRGKRLAPSLSLTPTLQSPSTSLSKRPRSWRDNLPSLSDLWKLFVMGSVLGGWITGIVVIITESCN